MKKSFQLLALIILTSLLALQAGYQSARAEEGAHEYISDATITAKVKAAILDEPGLKSMEIKVETFKGTVKLTGYVNSQAAIQKALEVAGNVYGVKSVENRLQLKELN